MKQQAQYRIVSADTGRCMMAYASRAYADAWLQAHQGFSVHSQCCDSPSMELYTIYGQDQRAAS